MQVCNSLMQRFGAASTRAQARDGGLTLNPSDAKIPRRVKGALQLLSNRHM